MEPLISLSAKLNSTAWAWAATRSERMPTKAKPALAGAKRNTGLRDLISIETLLRGQIIFFVPQPLRHVMAILMTALNVDWKASPQRAYTHLTVWRGP